MKRIVLLVLLGSCLGGVATNVTATSENALPGQVCVELWNDQNGTRDGVCVVGPDRPW